MSPALNSWHRQQPWSGASSVHSPSLIKQWRPIDWQQCDRTRAARVTKSSCLIYSWEKYKNRSEHQPTIWNPLQTGIPVYWSLHSGLQLRWIWGHREGAEEEQQPTCRSRGAVRQTGFSRRRKERCRVCLKFHSEGLKSKTGGWLRCRVCVCVCARERERETSDTMKARSKIREPVRGKYWHFMQCL